MIRNFLESCDYEYGYTKAVSDIKNYLESHSETLKWHKMNNLKGICEILSLFEKEHDTLLKYGPDIEVIVNYEGKKRILSVNTDISI